MRSVEKILLERSESKCELCRSAEKLDIYDVPPESKNTAEDSILICETCQDQINTPDNVDVNHWRCLNDSMWTQVPAVQVVVWRMLTCLKKEGWPQNLLEMLYLDDETLSWAQASSEGEVTESNINHLDSNGAQLEAGDTVTLIKDLNVKGANFTAKRGTAVRGISLVADNEKQIEGKINGQQIVILTEFVKKTS